MATDWTLPENDGDPSVWVKQLPEGVEMTQEEYTATLAAQAFAERAESAMAIIGPQYQQIAVWYGTLDSYNSNVIQLAAQVAADRVQTGQDRATVTAGVGAAAASAQAAANSAQQAAQFDPARFALNTYVDQQDNILASAIGLKASQQALTDGLAAKADAAATTTALAGKAAMVHTHTVADLSDASANGRSWLQAATYAAMKALLSLVKADVGLGSVDNTSDANKPLSVATMAYGSLLSSFRNKLINYNFDFWQRGTTQTSAVDGYGSDDRWFNQQSIQTRTHNRVVFALGQIEVPGNPTAYSETIVTGAGSTAAIVSKYQWIESVATSAGLLVTMTFWAKSPTAGVFMSTELVQNFGSGGSATVTGIGAQKFALTTAWKKYTRTIQLPSIAGKTIGTGSALGYRFWFSAGSDADARTAALGVQTGTFHVASASLVDGNATNEADPTSPRHVALENLLCQRYYSVVYASGRFPASAGSQFLDVSVSFPVPMRTVPTTVIFSAGTSVNILSSGFYPSSNTGGRFEIQSSAAGDTYALNNAVAANAEI